MFTQFLKRLPVVLALCFSVSAYADNSPTDVKSGSSATLGVSDQEIAQKVKDKLAGGWFTTGYDQVKVQVTNGVVTLTGMVNTWDDKKNVEKEVRDIKGVVSLDSQIKVQEESSKENQKRQFSQDTYGTAADDQLNKKIRDTVSRGWLWDSYKDVSLNTNNGVVVLEGSVNTLADQQKIMKEIQKIEEVKSVKSNLKINKN